MAQSLRHIKREKSMLPMKILVQQREILAMMNQFNHPVLIIQREIGRERYIRCHACSKNQQVPVKACKWATARKRMKYRQCLKHRREEFDRMLNAELRDDVPSVKELMDSLLSHFITFAANRCGYSGTTKELIVNWVHPLFLKAKADASKQTIPIGGKQGRVHLPMNTGKLL
jgi:hypothetical protein